MRLQDLPDKISRRIIRSVIWTGVDDASPSRISLRRLIVLLNRIGGRAERRWRGRVRVDWKWRGRSSGRE
jgi:hypothetical protein